MLVLTRRPLEEIVIAGNIRVKVLEISGSRVRLGISAPDQVPVWRGELANREPAHATHEREVEFELAGTSC
jgi:carbon storage regulator